MRISDWSSDVCSSDLFRRNARHGGYNRFDLFRSDGLAPLGGRHQHLHRTHLINHVDGLVGQLAIIDVARGKLHGRLDRVGRVFDFVVIFEGAAEPSRSEEHTSELQSLMRISYAVFGLKKKKNTKHKTNNLTAA